MGVYSLTVSTGDMLAPGVRSEFAGWADGVFVPERSVELPAGGPLEVGFNLDYLITPRFIHSQTEVVDPGRISALTLMSSTGRQETIDRIAPFWLQGSRVVRGAEGLETREIGYHVDSVIVDGANVVNQSQQRFRPSESQDWTVAVLFHSIRFIARDALFGFPTGSAIRLTYPDGKSQSFALEADGQVFIDALPRGQYRVQLEGAGLSSARPLVLSRSQDAPVLLISYLDVGVIFGCLMSIAVVLLLLGRGADLRRLIRGQAASHGPARSEP
jgi:hypothetical protein